MAENDGNNSALAGLRRQIDQIDDGLQDLLIRRTELVEAVGRLKQASDVVTFRPGREAQILRRLVGRHRGRFPRAGLVRIWREILSAAVAMQAELPVAVCRGCWDLARDHFGSHAPLVAAPTADETMIAVAEGRAALGVLPLAEEDCEEPWWRRLSMLDDGRPRVIARLPFGALGNAVGDYTDAFVIADVAPDPSGDDCTLLAIETALETATLTGAFLDAGIDVDPIARCAAGGSAAHLVEVETLVDDGDRRLARMLKALGAGGRIEWLGSYARPLPDAALNGVAPE